MASLGYLTKSFKFVHSLKWNTLFFHKVTIYWSRMIHKNCFKFSIFSPWHCNNYKETTAYHVFDMNYINAYNGHSSPSFHIVSFWQMLPVSYYLHIYSHVIDFRSKNSVFITYFSLFVLSVVWSFIHLLTLQNRMS